jgi:diguanylate cyclase
MRYSETKEQSSELLRLTLPLMARQTAAYHPVSYSLWYEHVGGINPPLSEVLAARLKENRPLTEDDAYRLHAQFISARDIQLVESLEQQLRFLLEDTAQQAALTGEETGRFGQALRNSRSELTGAVSLEGIHYVISQLVHATLTMESSTEALSKKLEASVAEVRVLTEQLKRSQTEALLDPLCGLNNRRGFERAAQEIAGADNDIGGTALLLADVDHFKRVNDTHGHLLGDKVLRTIAQMMRANIKGRDVAARIGGEEFAILLPNTTLQGALALAEHLRLAVANGRIQKGQGPEVVGSITLSIGVAVALPGATFEALMERADAALYRAKREGRNRVCSAEAP